MKCKLCNEDKKLLKHSHIIPDFMYKGLFDEKHFIAPLDLIEFEVKKFISNGFYDSNILCEKCDNNILGSLESYASIVIWGGKGNPKSYPSTEHKTNQLNQKYLYLTNIDYSKFKLFLLSIIWRASISKQKIFNTVSLGEHENIIGRMILENNPGKFYDYPVGIFVLTQNKNIPTKMISNPVRVNKDSDLSYLFLINGFVLNFKIDGQGNKELYDFIGIKENNTMNVFLFDEKDSQEFLDNYLKKKLRFNNLF